MLYAFSPVMSLERHSIKNTCVFCQFCFDTVPICFNLDVYDDNAYSIVSVKPRALQLESHLGTNLQK